MTTKEKTMPLTKKQQAETEWTAMQQAVEIARLEDELAQAKVRFQAAVLKLGKTHKFGPVTGSYYHPSTTYTYSAAEGDERVTPEIILNHSSVVPARTSVAWKGVVIEAGIPLEDLPSVTTAARVKVKVNG